MSVEAPATKKDEAQHALRYGIPINYRWMVEFVLLPVIIAGAAFWLTTINARITDLDVQVQSLRIEARGDQTNIQNMEKQLDSIDKKLDTIINNRLIQ